MNQTATQDLSSPTNTLLSWGSAIVNSFTSSFDKTASAVAAQTPPASTPTQWGWIIVGGLAAIGLILVFLKKSRG